jgi:GNAT superfamily N-acetyltransferase
MVTILLCQTRKHWKLFEQTPELLHQHDPHFVPPFPGTVVKLIDEKSPFRTLHGDIHCYIALRDGKVVGRIAAIVNRSHNKYYNDKVGFFGFFDFIDDQEVAETLLDTAVAKLREQGLEVARGPYNPSVNDECGLLVDGFESSPFVMMIYNPPYYVSMYEKLGLTRARDLHAFYLSAAGQSPELIERIVRRTKRNSGLTLRPINLKRLDIELPILQKLYNCTLNRNWGYVPITYEDLQCTAKDLKDIADPNMILIAEKNGQAVGFSLCLPNINEFLMRSRKLKGIFRFLKVAWLIKTQKTKEVRMVILGVDPEYRNSGIAALFYHEALSRGRNNILGGELSWVEESNKEIIHAITVMGGKQYKNYRIFEKSTTA